MLAILAALLLCCAFTDLSRGKVYNLVVFPAFAGGVLIRIDQYGMSEMGKVLSLAGPPIGLLLFLWLCSGAKAIGAGDIKLYMAVSVLCSREAFWNIFALSFLAAAIWSVMVLLPFAGGLCGIVCGHLEFPGGQIGCRNGDGADNRIHIPMAAAVLCAAMAYYGGRK